MLNLKDENIVFDENFYSEEIIKGVRSQVYTGTLFYKPKCCPKCDCIFDKNIKNMYLKHLLLLYLKYLI